MEQFVALELVAILMIAIVLLFCPAGQPSLSSQPGASSVRIKVVKSLLDLNQTGG
ncbi:hypothetical protein AB7008_38030 [Bradyrhizobium sp. 521_C7_N1_3]|uniref:hypothetical protein n=1 Tax=Bradyrhizobium sp. 521_C7_N1_3 TaxID=3240368 RepID=UPI003F88FBB3